MFWDSSAIVPLLFPESTSAEMAFLLSCDEEPTIWRASPVECLSAIYRRHRESPLPAEVLTQALGRLEALRSNADVVMPSEEVRIRAGRLLGVHPLRAAHALQLAGALAWSLESPVGETFACLDERLRDAARREGFQVVPA